MAPPNCPRENVTVKWSLLKEGDKKSWQMKMEEKEGNFLERENNSKFWLKVGANY